MRVSAHIGLDASTHGWFKAIRGTETTELLKANKNAFLLLFVIALRAQRTTAFNRCNLKPGEAPIGDYSNCGMTEGEYRTAKKNLQQWRFATFRATNRGTIATLMDTRIFDVNLEQSDEQNDTRTTGWSDGRGHSGQNCRVHRGCLHRLVRPWIRVSVDYRIFSLLPRSRCHR